MNSANKSLLLKIFFLVALFATVNCSKDAKSLVSVIIFKILIFLKILNLIITFFCLKSLIKKGIVLKCQGNPVSCYGKRSAALAEEPILEQLQDSQSDSSSDLFSEERLESNFEKILETLISNCKSGNTKSCNTMLKIMLLNSN